MELGHLLTRSGLTYPEVSSKVCHDSFCQLGNSVSLPWVIYYGAFYLHVVSSFSYIPVICLKLVLFLIPLQFVHLFCNQSKCGKGKGKAIPLQSWTGPESSRSLRLPDFKIIGTWSGNVVSPRHRPPLPARKYSWYSFLLEAESTPGP